MANIKISQLPAKGANLGSADLLEVSEFTGTGYVSKSITGQEIIDAIPAGAAVNPTSTYMPYNDSGVFEDSKISQVPTGFFSNSFEFNSQYDVFKVSTNPIYIGYDLLNLNGGYQTFTLGNASTSTYAVSANFGLAINGNQGEAIIGCGISSPTNGFLRASGSGAAAWIGNSIGGGIGHNFIFGTIHIGSGMILNTGSHTQTHWAVVTDENFNTYYLPLYT